MVVSPYPDLPMEEVFARQATTHEAGVFIRQTGPGRIAYFPWDVDRTFWEVLKVDHGMLLRDAVRWVTNEPAPVSVKGAGILALSIWRQKNSLTVHLVNLTNLMMMKGPLLEIIPVSRQQVRILIPDSRHIAKVHLLVASQSVPYQRDRDSIELEIPAIDLHEVIAIDFAS
jgi:hypothetical protein